MSKIPVNEDILLYFGPNLALLVHIQDIIWVFLDKFYIQSLTLWSGRLQ